MTEDELHNEIAEARKEQFEFRADVFRRKQPKVGTRLYKAQWKVVVAKEIFNQRRKEKYGPAFQAELKANVTGPMANKWTEEMQINAIQSYWQKPMYNRKTSSKAYGYKENNYLKKVIRVSSRVEAVKGPGLRAYKQQAIDDVAKFEKEKGVEVKRRNVVNQNLLKCSRSFRSREALKAIEEKDLKIQKKAEEREAAASAAPPAAASAFGNSRSTSRSASQLPLAGGAVAISALTAALFASGRRHRRGGRA